jgi:hypothetical protein
MLQKEVSWPKKIFNTMHGFKSAILAIFQFWQNGTFELLHEIQFFLAERLLLKPDEGDIYTKFS